MVRSGRSVLFFCPVKHFDPQTVKYAKMTYVTERRFNEGSQSTIKIK